MPATVVAPRTAPLSRREGPRGNAPRAAARLVRVLRPVGFHLLVVAAFALPAIALWWHAWDGHLSSTLTCACGDPGQSVWFVEWPAYAMAHGLDPFFSPALQAPYGVNLLANASAVPLGIVLAPLTLTAGPVAATNVALTLCPALSAWGCWLACRSLVRRRLPSAVAGALFGYSPFVVTNLALGHLGLALLVAPPLLLLATRRVLFGAPAHRLRWGAALGALAGLQFLVSSEILAIVVVVGVPCALVAAIAGRRSLAPAAELLRAAGLGCLVGALLLAFPLWFFFAGPQHLHGVLWRSAPVQGNALYALWNPGRYGALGGTLLRVGGYEGRAGPPSSYLGPVVLVLAIGAVAAAWRRRAAWILALGGLVAIVLSFGIVLWLTPGRALTIWLPWRLVSGWPLLDDVIPQRFSAVTDLCVALLIAVGLDAVWGAVVVRRRAGRRSAVPGRLMTPLVVLVSVAAAASTWWTYQVPFVTRHVSTPAWYAQDAPRLPAGSVVLSYPFPFPLDGSSGPMVWQAVDGMRFDLAGGYVKVPGPGGRPLSTRPVAQPYDVLARLSARAAGGLPEITAREVTAVRRALSRWRVDDVVVVARGRDPALAVRLFTEAIARPPQRELGAWVWRLPRR